MGKRYYWLKLQDGFFHSKRIKRMRNLEHGADYIVIYLKMQLVAMKKDGFLEFDGVDGDTFAEDISLDIDEDADRVSEAIEYMIARKLAIMQDDGKRLFLPWAVENVGAETADAKRKRDQRQQNSDNVHDDADNVRTMSENCHGEKRREEKRRIGCYTTDDSRGKLSPVSDGPQGEECFIDVNES